MLAFTSSGDLTFRIGRLRDRRFDGEVPGIWLVAELGIASDDALRLVFYDCLA